MSKQQSQSQSQSIENLFVTFLAATAYAFSPSQTRSVQKARFVPPAVPLASQAPFNPWALRMSDDEKSEASKVGADGTFYDDEKEPEVKKEGISDSMRAKLLAEASTGLDSEQKQPNVILYIILGVGVLVLLGGQGIFF